MWDSDKYLWHYRATVTRIIDGDTIEVDIDLGFKTTLKKERIRLLGIDTPELRSRDESERARAKLAKEYVESVIPVGTEVRITTRKDEKGKYGRYLAQVRYKKEDGTEYLLDQSLREHNHQK